GWRHAPPGPQPYCRWRRAGGNPRVDGGALRRLHQLHAASDEQHMAAFRHSPAHPRGDRLCPARQAGAGAMIWLAAIGLALAVIGAGFGLFRLRGAQLLALSAAMALGLALFATQAR